MPFQPYAQDHANISGPGDARPTAMQIVNDLDLASRLQGRNILITGCSSGIGIETARALYKTGAQLFLTARDMPKLHDIIESMMAESTHATSTTKPQAVELNLDSLQSVRQAAAEVIAQTKGKLDMLILNGGVMAGKLQYTKDGFENQLGTNHFSGFLLFQLLQPALSEATQQSGQHSRVIVLSSAAHLWSPVHFYDLNWTTFPMTYNQWQAYGSSKTANIYLANAIDRKFGQAGIRALSVHPGGIATGLTRSLQGEDFVGFGDVAEIYRTYKSAEQGAATTVWAALSPYFEDGHGGQYLADCGETIPWKKGDRIDGSGYASHAYDEASEERLWTLSRELTGSDAK